MRTGLKTAFRPSLERFEARVVATGGVASAAAHHVAAHPAVHVASHHPSRQHHPAPHPAAPHRAAPHRAAPHSVATGPAATDPAPRPSANQSGATGTTSSPSTPQPPAPPPSLPTNTSTNQAWVEIVNTTGQSLEYYIKLAPYANGQFLPFDIGPGETQYRFSSLISNGQRVKADFAIQFGNGPITPLNTGISEASAQGYYIFFDSNFQPYVAPFINS